MKRKNRIISVLVALVMSITYLIPFTTVPLKAASLVITELKQGGSDLAAGDNFTIIVKVASEGTPFTDKPSISVFGGAVNADNMSYDIKYWTSDKTNKESEVPEEITIRGLKYTGYGKEVTVNVEGDFKTLKLSATEIDEGKEHLKVDDSVNLLVKTDATQNAQVKVVNQGKQTLKNVKVKLDLAESVEGIKIKTGEITIPQINAKETKTASFSVEVDKEVKAKVYKATATVQGVGFPVNLQVDSNVMPSVIEVGAEANKVFKPGVTQEATISLKNVGERAAKNIRAEFNSENVSIVGGSNVKHISVINAKAKSDITLNLKVDSKYAKGTVPIKVDLTYLNSLGEETKDSQTIYLSTSTTATANSEVVIDKIVSPGGIYGVNENFNINFTISSPAGAENIKITAKGDEGIVPKSQNKFSISKLKAGEKKEYTVSFAATSAAESSAHAIEVSVEYGDGEKPETINQYGSASITNPKKDKENDKDEETKKGSPKVIIGEYKIDPVVVKAGEKFELSLGFLNTHKVQAVHNFKASLKVIEEGENNAGNVFTPVGASNTFFISDLQPGETTTKNITLYTIPSAKPKTYEVTLEMEYEDDKGNEVKATENIGVPVEGMTKIEVGDVQVEQGQVGMPLYFNATLYNKGKTSISNLMIHLEGEGFTVQDNKVFIGNFDSQATETYSPTIIPDQAGTLSGTMVIEYEDTTGETKQIVKDFVMDVAEMMQPEPGEMDPGMMEEPSKAKWPLIVGGGAGVLVAIIVTVVVLKKRKAKKEKMMLDEDD